MLDQILPKTFATVPTETRGNANGDLCNEANQKKAIGCAEKQKGELI